MISVNAVRTRRYCLYVVWLLWDFASSLEQGEILPSPGKTESNGSIFRINNRMSNSQNEPSEITHPLHNTKNLIIYDDFFNYPPQKYDNSSFYETKSNSPLDGKLFFSSNGTSKNIEIQNLKEIENDFLQNNRVQSDDNSIPFGPPLIPADPPSDLFTLPLQSVDLLPVIDNVNTDPFNKFLTAPTVPYNMEGSEIIEPEFIVPDNLAFSPPVPPPFVQPVKTYALTINDGTVKRNEVRKDNGEYISSYTSADGTMRSESARLIKTSTGEEVLVYKGSYSYSTPDGQRFRVDYTADRAGFRSTSTPVTAKPTQVSTSTQQPVTQGSSQQPQRPYQKPPQKPFQQQPQRPNQQTYQNPYQNPPQNPYQQRPQKPYQQPPQKPYQQQPQKPYQQPPQNPYQQPPQNPYQQPPQKPYQQPPQKPYQQPPQKPYQQPPQKPYQQQPQKPYQQPPQNPYQQPTQNPYQQPPQKPYQQPPQKPYQQIPQKPPTVNPYQQTSQSPYQQRPQNPYQKPQTHPIAVQHLPFSTPKRPKKPPSSPAPKPTQIPIIILPKPHLQGHSRLPLLQPNQQSNKPPVYIKLPQKPVPHLTNEILVHPIPPIPNMHRPIKG